jgi:hypothetical protein
LGIGYAPLTTESMTADGSNVRIGHRTLRVAATLPQVPPATVWPEIIAQVGQAARG